MLAQVPSLLVDLGVLAGILTALTTAAKAPVVGRPVRFVWGHLVTQPMAAWFRSLITDTMRPQVDSIHDRLDHLGRRIDDATIELRPNGGSSIKDQVARLAGDRSPRD